MKVPISDLLLDQLESRPYLPVEDAKKITKNPKSYFSLLRRKQPELAVWTVTDKGKIIGYMLPPEEK